MVVLAPAATAHETWRAPVAGRVTKPFDLGPNPFAPGNHRGADFEAPPGTAIHAACSGRVVVAGRVGTSGRLVTIACGSLRATHMPLATIAVRRGATVHRGATLGTAAPSSGHAGVHLGARRADDRFGYVDPLSLIRADRPPPAPPVAAPIQRMTRPRRAPAPVRRPPVIAAPQPAGRTLAPWPAWAGLAMLLAGAVGTGVRVQLRVRARGRTVAAARQEAG